MKINNAIRPSSLRFSITALAFIASFAGLACAAGHLLKVGDAYADVSGAYTYTVSGGTATITAYDAGIGGVTPTIPATLGGNTVTAITSGAFTSKGLTSVTFPEGLETIDSSTFAGNSLTTVSLPNSLTSIGSYAFSANPLTTLSIGTSNYVGTPHLVIDANAFSSLDIATLSLGKNILTIGASAFYNNDITSVTVPGNITTIGSDAFMSNPLTSVVLQEGIQTIDYGAFNQTQLTSVAIPNSVTTLNPGSFNTSTLTSVSIGTSDYSGPASLTLTGAVFDLTALSSLTLGNSIAVIGGGAFAGATHLTSVVIPDSVTTIASGAFNNAGLTSLTLGNSVTTIGGGAFYGCDIQSLVIPDSVTLIDSGAFGQNQLTSLTLGSSVETIVGGAFTQNKLTTVTIPASVTSIGIQAFYQNNLMRVIIEGNPAIGDEAFAENGIDRATLPVGTSRGDDAWYDYMEAHASLVNLYTTDPEATLTDTLYVDGADGRLIGGYIVNPSALTVRFRTAGGTTLSPSTYATSPTLADYLIANTLDTSVPGAPTVDFSPYYRLGDSVATSPVEVSGYVTPAAQTATLSARNNAQGAVGTVVSYVYLPVSSGEAVVDDNESNASSTVGTPNTGLGSTLPTLVGFAGIGVLLIAVGVATVKRNWL